MKYVEKIATQTLTVVILIAITVESLVSVSMCKAGVTMATVKLKYKMQFVEALAPLTQTVLMLVTVHSVFQVLVSTDVSTI